VTEYVLTQAATENRKCENGGDGDFLLLCSHRIIFKNKQANKQQLQKSEIVLCKHTDMEILLMHISYRWFRSSLD